MNRHSRSSLHVAQIIPTPYHGRVEGSDPPTVQRSSSTSLYNEIGNSSGDDLDVDTASTTSEEREDHSDGGQFRFRNERNYQSFRLDSNSLGTQLQRNIAQVTPNRYASFRLHLSQPQTEENDDSFTFLPPDQEPKIPTKQLQRAKKAIENIAATTSNFESEGEEEKKRSCCECLFTGCKRKKTVEEEEENEFSTEISPEMQRASRQGLSMLKKIMFPALPAVLQDLWVFLELAISIVIFVISLTEFVQKDSHTVFSSFCTTLASVSMILALIDAYFYFFQQGNLARGLRACWKRLKSGRQVQEEAGSDTTEDKEVSEGEDGKKKCCHLSEKWRERFDTWFELVRTVLSELLLYPQIVFEMFGFIPDATYDVVQKPQENQRDFSFSVVGWFYLILGVYIMRIFIIAGSMTSLIRIPKSKQAKDGSFGDISILVKFCVHTLEQIAVHLLLILALAVKINNEHEAIEILNDTNSSLSLPDHASPFLITTILLGWVVPFAGVLMFFVVNYYWMKEFSIGFWLNMISMLQAESFAETVFGGEGLAMTKEKALDFIEKSQYKKVKKQLKRFKGPPFWTKFFFPLRVPLTAICGLLYDIILLGLIACLMLTSDPVDGTVKPAVFTNDPIMTSFFVISATAIIIANIHVLILVNMVLLIMILILTIAVALAVFISPLILCVYFPSVALAGYCMLCIEPSKISRRNTRHKIEEIMGEVISNPVYEMGDLFKGNGNHGLETTEADGFPYTTTDSSVT